MIDQRHIPFNLRPQTAQKAGICHRIERMIFHSAFVQQRSAHKKMPVVNRPPIHRQRGNMHHKVASHFSGQRITDRADISHRGGIEG